ncbi:GNAT family N-acetyltransferase [Halotalea alkalilenta]|uniref:GCN5 family acetyltransferase n=1 Tax=Halotalea alkalilenta TaxID=376489 RepID=A0A172YCR5_9GAMM|nr:GNAT family N-acetyltransferase [Halotalea alkalilenta]ANF57004.1 GCN5 family acetyltransferase [Halotalea alkalilenta]
MSAAAPLVRDAAEGDVAELVALVTEAYHVIDAGGWTTEASLLGGQRIDPLLLRRDIQRPRSRVIVAERDGRLLGCGHLALADGEGSFGMFAVRPSLQGEGIGRLLLGEAECLARDWLDVEWLRITVIEQRGELIEWYQRRGFCRSGVYKPFPYGDERFGVPLRDDLRFEVLEKRLV